MRKIGILLITIMIMILILSVVPAAASSPPKDVNFEVEVTDAAGPFNASGPAVDEGLVCDFGETFAELLNVSGDQGNMGFNVQVIYRFTCDDGSGSFLVKLQVRIDQKGDNFNWVILGGTGDYEKLHGTGKGVGLPLSPDMVLDLYEGKVHID